MKNLAFHSLLRWKVIVLPMLTTSCIHFSLGRLGECTFWTWEWKGSKFLLILCIEAQLYAKSRTQSRYVSNYTWDKRSPKTLEYCGRKVCIVSEHFISLNHLMNLVVKVLWNVSFVFLFLFVGTHFRIFVHTFLVHLRTVYASPQKLQQPLSKCSPLLSSAELARNLSQSQGVQQQHIFAFLPVRTACLVSLSAKKNCCHPMATTLIKWITRLQNGCQSN